MDLDAIRAAVADAFRGAGAVTPGWPDPHPDHNPDDSEYSRCLDPAKYRVVGARVEAWLRALDALGLATVEDVDDVRGLWRDDPPYGAATMRGHRVRPSRPGALPLLVGLRDLDGVPDSVVTLGAGEPAVAVTTVPDCGCDACDSGSADLLEALDDHVLDVVSGEFLHVTTARGTVLRRRNGWSAQGFGGERALVEQLLTDAAAGRSPHAVVRGARWW